MSRVLISKITSKGSYENYAYQTEDDVDRIMEMLLSQCPPGHSGTDKTFWEGKVNGHSVDEAIKSGDYIRAKRAGVDTSGKLYVSGIADRRGPGDPSAWVSGLDDLRAVVKRRGITCEGIVKNRGPEVEPNKPVPLAEDIVERVIKREVKANPNLKKKPRQELREMVIAKHGRKV